MADNDLINDLSEGNSQDSKQNTIKEIQPDPDAIESAEGKMAARKLACMLPLLKVILRQAHDKTMFQGH